MEKITLNVKEVAGLLGVSAQTIYTMVREDQIPHSKIRSKIVFHKGTIEAWLAKGVAV